MNGYSCWLPRGALEWPPFKSAKVCYASPRFRSWIILTRDVRVALGAHVIACASPSKLDVARTTGGADFVVDYTQGGWQKEVLKITGGRGVDVVYDPVGRIKGAVPFSLATKGYLIMVN